MEKVSVISNIAPNHVAHVQLTTPAGALALAIRIAKPIGEPPNLGQVLDHVVEV